MRERKNKTIAFFHIIRALNNYRPSVLIEEGRKNRKGGQNVISALKKMEKQILEEIDSKIRDLIPGSEISEEGNKNFISYKILINGKDFGVSIVITNGRAVSITGKRSYIYQIKEKNCVQFNDDVRTKYPAFQIYGGNGNFSVGRRFLFDSVDVLVSNVKEFNSVCEAVVLQFES